MSLYRRGKLWWIYLVHNGRRVRRSTETSDKSAAKRIHDEFRAELWKVKGGHTFRAAIELWERAVKRDPADIYRLNKLLSLYPDRLVSLVTSESLDAVLPASSPGTFNRYANLVTAVLNLARRRGWIQTIPHIERKRTPANRLRWLTYEEWLVLRQQLPVHLRDMAEFSVLTGLRQKNVTHLRWDQVDLRNRRAWIHADEAKGRVGIGVPLSDEACAILVRNRGPSEWVFPYKGRPIGKIKTAWRKALKRADIQDFTWHGLRHTWASWHVQAGTPLAVLKELGGWRSLSMVQRYAHLAPEHLRAYAGNLGHTFTPQPRLAAAKK